MTIGNLIWLHMTIFAAFVVAGYGALVLRNGMRMFLAAGRNAMTKPRRGSACRKVATKHACRADPRRDLAPPASPTAKYIA